VWSGASFSSVRGPFLAVDEAEDRGNDEAVLAHARNGLEREPPS